MDKQMGRGEDLFKNLPKPHEKRFESFQVSDSWSNIPRVPVVLMDRQLARDQMLVYRKKNYAPDY